MEPGRKPPAWRRYLRFWGADVDADVDDELQFHLDMRARDYEACGLTARDARDAAVERFGDVSGIGGALRAHDRRRERERQRKEYMSDFSSDVRFGLRAFVRAPAFTTVALLTIALGIGATTAIFSVVNAVILRPLPYPDADRIVQVWMDNRRMGLAEDLHSWPNYADLRDQNRVFSHMAAYATGGYNITGGCREGECEPRRVAALFSTADLFDVLRVAPAMGRGFSVQETVPGSDAVVVISHGLWTGLLGADRNVLGRTVRLNGRERTVIGVLPPTFAFPNRDTDVWVPLALDEEARQFRGSFGFWSVARLRPGVEFSRAVSDLTAIAARLEQQYADVNRDLGVHLVPLPEQVIGRSLRTSLWVMLAAVGAVLLIACANVANLMLSRAAVREREIGVRVALGAARARLVRQLLTESVLLSVIGAALGVGLAWAGLRVLTSLAPADIPRLDQVRIDLRVLGVALGLAVITGIAFGLAPALQSSRAAVGSALREATRGGTSGRRAQRLRRSLVAAQIALVVVLLIGAGLLIRSFIHLQRVDLGFRPDNLLTMRLSLPGAKYQTPESRVAFFDALVDRTRQLPGVQGAALIEDIFLSATPTSTTFTIEGREMTQEERSIEVPLDAVSPDYFKVMGIPLREGRTFTASDNQAAPPAVIINENMARRFWPNESPVGKRFKYGGVDSQAPFMTVVGVVGDMRRTGFDAPVRYETFRPHKQRAVGFLTLVVRTAGDPARLVPAVRAEVKSVDPDQPVFEVASMDQLLGAMVAQRRFSMALLGTFATLALVLGVVGVYGVTSYLVAQRTREVGVRLALGAQPGQVVSMVVRQGMAVAAAGLVAGLAGALAAGRLLTGLLYGVGPHDLGTFAGVTAVIAVATLAANWVPALRAARVDPLTALRSE
ncbi:MAG TPA: ABC transporter permease [Gemmatimonadaceae bacterium]|jgi:putative ABC transport system permease protein|nr:ABC transporter permease [Gemmatimonadaceae bacterium]